MLVLALFSLAVTYYYYFYKKTKDILNPVGMILVIWCVTAAISALYLLPLQEPWGFRMVVVVIGKTFAVFWAGRRVLPEFKDNYVLEEIYIPNIFFIITRAIFFISLVCVLIEWRFNDFMLPGLATISGVEGVGDIKSLMEGLPVIHYGSILMPFCGIFAFFELKYTKGRKLFSILVLLTALVFYSYLIQISRGSLLTIFLGCLYIQHKKKPISFKLLAPLISIVLTAFVGIARFRVVEGSMVFQSIEGESPFAVLVSPIVTYIGYNFENLRKLVEYDSHSYTFFHLTFMPIYHILGMRGGLNLTLFDTKFFVARTYIYPFYHDLGLLGVIIFPFLISAFVSLIYRKSRRNKPEYIILLAALQRAIVYVFFGNYFFGEFILIWPYLVAVVVMKSLKYKLTKQGSIKLLTST